MKPSRKCLLAALASLALLTSPAIAAESGYKVLSRIETAGAGVAQSFQVDPVARRLYAARDGGVDVYDIDNGNKTGTVSIAGTVGGMALAPDLGRGYASASGSNQIVVFDLANLATLATVKSTGSEPREIEYEAKTRRAYVSNAKGGLTVIDGATGKVVDTVRLGGDLRQASADGRGHLFVADQAKNVLHVVDTGSLKSLGEISVWPGTQPTAIANDVAERRLYVACGNGKMIIVDPDPGQMISLVSTQATGAAGMAMQVAPARLVRLYIPSADGKLSVIQNAKLTATLEDTVEAGATSSAVAFDQKTGHAFIASGSEILVVGK